MSTWADSWGGDAGSWLTSWSSTFVPPPAPEPQTVTPAGKARHRRRYYVEIDGQQFEVANAADALQLLQRARALAEQVAETEARKIEAKTSRVKKPKPVRLAVPTVTASPELNLDLAPFRADLARIYDNQAALAELRLLLQRAIEDDEEETILLLM